MSWSLEGSYLEVCNCNVVCPCTASLSFGATNDRCNVIISYDAKSAFSRSQFSWAA